ncbi:MAG: DUF308 domain-containing protein [Acidimicrobiales bacterium]
MRSLAGSLLWRGLLAVVVGIIAIAWPGVTILAVVIIFAIAAFGASIGQAVRAFSSNGFGPVIGHLLLSLLDVAAGLVAVLWPGITAFALTIWIGIWAVVSGFGEFVMAFAYGETGGQRFLFGLTGLVTIALGIVLFARPDVGAVALAEVFGLFSLATGIANLVLAGQARHEDRPLSHMAS